jgi:hypothetical protein
MGKIQWSPSAFETNILALTSNEGAFDFQTLSVDGKNYTSVLETSKTWKNSENLMYVVGATKQHISQKYVKLFQIVSC